MKYKAFRSINKITLEIDAKDKATQIADYLDRQPNITVTQITMSYSDHWALIDLYTEKDDITPVVVERLINTASF